MNSRQSRLLWGLIGMVSGYVLVSWGLILVFVAVFVLLGKALA